MQSVCAFENVVLQKSVMKNRGSGFIGLFVGLQKEIGKFPEFGGIVLSM